MAMLHSLLLACAAAGAVSASVVPQPSSAQAMLSHKNSKNSKRMDIVRRVKHVKRQNGPSSVPTPPSPASCGDQLVGPSNAFYLSMPDPADPTRYLYASTSDDEVTATDSSRYRFYQDPSQAVSFYFDDTCSMRRSTDGQETLAWIPSEQTVSPLYIATQPFIQSQYSDIVSCVNDGGSLRCATNSVYMPLERSRFCSTTDDGVSYLWLDARDPGQTDCTPLTLTMTAVAPPQPPAPVMCGSQPVGVPFYVYGDNFLEPGTNIYLASADSDVTSSGYSFFQPVMESDQAVSYVFNDQCNLARTGIDSSTFVNAGQSMAILMLGSPELIESQDAPRVTCTSDDGVLRCWGLPEYMPAESTVFCHADLSFIYLKGDNAPSNCHSVTMRISPTPNPTPPSPVYCGDIAVNEPFALYGSDPTDATKYLYGRAAGQAIALDGYANLIKVNDPAIADMYFLNEFCHLTRNDGTSVSRLAVNANEDWSMASFHTSESVVQQGVDVLVCTSDGGALNCGGNPAYLPYTTASFCLPGFGAEYFVLTSRDPASVSCSKVSLLLAATPPPQLAPPPPPTCGDLVVNRNFRLYRLNPANPAQQEYAAYSTDPLLADGYSTVAMTSSLQLASTFHLNENCQLISTGGGYTLAGSASDEAFDNFIMGTEEYRSSLGAKYLQCDESGGHFRCGINEQVPRTAWHFCQYNSPSSILVGSQSGYEHLCMPFDLRPMLLVFRLLWCY